MALNDAIYISFSARFYLIIKRPSYFGDGQLQLNGREVFAIETLTFRETLQYIDKQEPHHDEDIKAGEFSHTEKEQMFNIFKTDEDKRLVFGWANIAIDADGKQLEDLQKDIIDPEDLEEAVYKYVLEFRDSGEEHIPFMRKKASLVESVMFTEEKMKAMGIPKGIVPEGWWVGFHVHDDDAWRRIKDGTYQMFSIEGKAIRVDAEDEIEKADRINGCGVLVVRDSKILCGTRIGGKHANQICGPGGHIERSEDPEEAAIREAYEEFGIECKNLTPLGILDGGRNYGKSAVFLCTEYEGEPQTDEEEMTDLQWLTPSELEEERLFKPFEQSLELLAEKLQENSETEKEVSKTFDEVMKFNPFHDDIGRFASSNGFKTYSANPKSKAGAMAIQRSMAGGHGRTLNVHRESKGESITQNARWLATGQKPKVPAVVSRARYQQRKQQQAQQQAQQQQQTKTPPQQNKPQTAPKQAPQKPQKNFDHLGFADYDDADFHQLHSGQKYYQQQKLTPNQMKAVKNYIEAHKEPGSLYSHSQNMNTMMVKGQKLTGKYKQTHDGLMSAMHNIGYNVELTRYDHAPFINNMLQALGKGADYRNLSQSQLKKALVGHSVAEEKFLSTSYDNFQNAPAKSRQVFDSRAVKITYKTKANVQAMMPGNGPGGSLGEIILAPTNGKSNPPGKIVDVKFTGKTGRTKGSQTYNMPQIEIVIEL